MSMGPTWKKIDLPFSKKSRIWGSISKVPGLLLTISTLSDPPERSILHMSPNENIFNEFIWEFPLQEIPLLDREFTWSNMQNPLVLSKLDIILINSS
jgi:hypothetical protein